MKSTELFQFKKVKLTSRKSNQYQIVLTVISESCFYCSFVDQITICKVEQQGFKLKTLAHLWKPTICQISKQFNEFIPQNQICGFSGILGCSFQEIFVYSQFLKFLKFCN
ncbi:Hypothetical_protein [Hexamita inflata]|uniref:Hypothetical_protein n=1 Tax=Hexamita inflata TaxID=28002 RepID=A0AA86RAZ3_9EUKA|nr:Hypothetical protein HINF_LOCUS56852 [Hexamita inflata]CAI9969214.1 Hypothetical protein HINF_LOCUS56859 [Hexamita inflata]